MNPNPCDLEPIHLINELQDFGLIFIFSMHEDKIVATGENIFDYLEISPEEAFTISLDRIFPDYENLKKLLIEHLIEKKHLEYKLLFPFSTSFFVAVFRKSDDFFICELEREDSNQILFNTNNFFNQVQELNQIQTLNTFYQHIVNEVQKMTLFDRVVIYRFDPEFNGEVLAESRKDDSIDSILGFHFPSSDIPLPARAMYKQNPLRMIQAHFDRKIILVKNKNYSNYSFDLGSSYLRTPHEHHLEYLKNMQIATSICVALSDGNRLWGLIICHSREKAIPLPSIRQNLILLSRIAYRHLDLLIQNENSQTIIKLKDELMEIIGKIYQISFTEIAIIFEFNLDKLMTTFQADGAIILFGDVKIHRGEIPDPENFQKLISVLEEKSDSENFLTNDIKDLFLEGSLDSNLRGGLFSFPISSKKKDRIYFFKKDALQKIVWAGNKNEAFLREENRISPRKSFTRWIEIVKGKSTNWNFSLRDIKEELQGIKDVIDKKLTKQTLIETLEKVSSSEAKLKELNATKDKFFSILSHDLRNPISGIAGIAEILIDLSKEKELDLPQIEEYANLLQQCSIKTIDLMQNLFLWGKIQTGKISIEKKNCSVSILFEDLEYFLSQRLKEKKIHLKSEFDSSLSIFTDEKAIQTILLNILFNAIKYSFESATIYIRLAKNQNQVNIEIEDSGIGIKEKDLEKLFRIGSNFKMPGTKQEDGTGLGLIIAKEYLNRLNGEIEISSTEGKGTKVKILLFL